MSIEYNGKLKRCATCEMWQGQRNLSGTRTYVVTDGNAKGICFLKNKVYLGNYSSCTTHKKWALLK